MESIPIPPAMPLPNAVQFPTPTIAAPTFATPEWEPVPIYRDDVPALNPKPKPAEERTEPEPEPEPEPPQTPPVKDVLNTVQQMTTPPPPLPPYTPVEPESQIETVEIPGGFELPVPKQEIMVTAVATAGAAAVASVGATLAASRIFNQLVKVLKPAIKIALKKIAKLRGKKPAPTWARQRLELRQRRYRRKD